MKNQNYPKGAILEDDSTTWCRTVFSAAGVTKILPDMESSSIYSHSTLLPAQAKRTRGFRTSQCTSSVLSGFAQHQNWVSGNHTVSFRHRLQPVFLLRVCHRKVLILSHWYRSVSEFTSYWVVSYFVGRVNKMAVWLRSFLPLRRQKQTICCTLCLSCQLCFSWFQCLHQMYGTFH